MFPPDLPALLGQVRELTRTYQAGGGDAFAAVRELVTLLLRLTILAPDAGLTLIRGPRQNVMEISGLGARPVRLTDGRYLRVWFVLYAEDTPQGRRVKVERSSFQYQLDEEGDRWIFRYDYLRNPPDPTPAMHLQIRGSLLERDSLPADVPLQRIHFPTHRIALEAVLRLLVDQFKVPARHGAEIWRPVLAEAEAGFLGIAHRSLSGPER